MKDRTETIAEQAGMIKILIEQLPTQWLEWDNIYKEVEQLRKLVSKSRKEAPGMRLN